MPPGSQALVARQRDPVVQPEQRVRRVEAEAEPGADLQSLQRDSAEFGERVSRVHEGRALQPAPDREARLDVEYQQRASTDRFAGHLRRVERLFRVAANLAVAAGLERHVVGLLHVTADVGEHAKARGTRQHDRARLVVGPVLHQVAHVADVRAEVPCAVLDAGGHERAARRVERVVARVADDGGVDARAAAADDLVFIAQRDDTDAGPVVVVERVPVGPFHPAPQPPAILVSELELLLGDVSSLDQGARRGQEHGGDGRPEHRGRDVDRAAEALALGVHLEAQARPERRPENVAATRFHREARAARGLVHHRVVLAVTGGRSARGRAAPLRR